MPYDHEDTIARMIAAFRPFVILSLEVTDDEIEQARRAISMAKSVGFVIDPTAYRDRLADGGLDRQEQIVELFENFRRRLGGIFADVVQLQRASK